MAVFSKRSKEALAGVNDKLVKVAERAIINPPHDFTIIEGVRTSGTQSKYYTWGRTVVNPNTGPLPGKPFGAIVTNRNGVSKKSEHQLKADGTGHALDFCPFINGRLAWENEKAFIAIGKHFKKVAAEIDVPIVWGGDWTGDLNDKPHIELK